MKAQSSLEFMMMIGVFMIMFLVFFAVFQTRMFDFQKDKDTEIANDMLFTMESEILIAADAHDGYKRYFTLPSQLNGYSYKLNFSDSEIILEYLNVSYVRTVRVNTSDSAFFIDNNPYGNVICNFDSVVHINDVSCN